MVDKEIIKKKLQSQEPDNFKKNRQEFSVAAEMNWR